MRDRERRIRLAAAMAAVALLAVAATTRAAVPDTPPAITGRAAIVLDATTGTVLWERDGHRMLPPASTTKIMTTVLALESGRLDRSFPVSSYASIQAPTKLGLRAGQRVGLEDLAYALMLKSANDAAVVVAEGLAGSVEEFAALMNARAREIGAKNTHFHNPHGLPDPDHLTTVYDMALILRHALTVPGFREIAGTSSKVIQIEDTKIRPVSLYSKNRLLNGYFVPVLGKTGYTRAAGRCFAGAAELNGRRVITVVFGASDMWGDTRKLMEYGFSSFDDTAPVVQLALEQARAQRTTVAKKQRKGASSSKVAKAKKSPAKTQTAKKKAPQSVAKSKKAPQSVAKAKKAPQSVAQAKQKASAAARERGLAATAREARASATASATRGTAKASQAAASANKRGKPSDQHAKLESGGKSTKR